MSEPKQRYDLHCHSNHSDGILSPESLVSRAKVNDVSVLALTDHDTTSGLSAAAEQAQREQIKLVPGAEFSCNWNGRNIHVVGLAFDATEPQLSGFLKEQAIARDQRTEKIASKMEKIGFTNALALAQSEASSHGTIGRPHFARAMVRMGFVNSEEQAFKKYLGAGKPGDVKNSWPEIGDVIDVIEGSGGVAVLAHPLKYKLTRTKLCHLIEDFVDSGGRSIEVVSGKQRAQDTNDLGRLAQKYTLSASCGSDFHMPGNQWNELGQFPELPEYLTPVWSEPCLESVLN